MQSLSLHNASCRTARAVSAAPARTPPTPAPLRAAPSVHPLPRGCVLPRALGESDHVPHSRRSITLSSLLLGCGFAQASWTAQEAAAASTGAVDKAGDWSSPGLNAPENDNLPKFFKTPSGVKVQELSLGKGGRTAETGDLVLFDYVLRRSNGYFIYGTVEGVSFQPKDVPVGPVAFKLGGDSPLIAGLQEALTGMSEGAKRRVLIPAEAGYVNCIKDEPQPPTFATRRQLYNHCKEPILFEIQLLRITRP